MARGNDNIELVYSHGIDIGSKTLYLGGSSGEDINPESASDIIRGLGILSRTRPTEPITIIINSGGGDVDQGLAIYDAIRNTSNTVNACVRGNCYSMAAWILQAADHRSMARNSSMMIHSGQTSIEGNDESAANLWEFYKQQDKRCFDIFMSRLREKNPKFAESKLKRMLRTDTYLWPEQALELGFIDEVLE